MPAGAGSRLAARPSRSSARPSRRARASLDAPWGRRCCARRAWSGRWRISATTSSISAMSSRTISGEAEPPEGKARHPAVISAWARALARETYAVLSNGRLPVVLGGDHSLAMGSVSGVARYAAEAGRKLFVLWLDAHSDYNTPLTSPSGNMHGMPAAMLSGEPGFDFLFGGEKHEFDRPRPPLSLRHQVDRRRRAEAPARPGDRRHRHADA